MARQNTRVAGTQLTTNREGVPAFQMGVIDKLITQCIATFFNEPKYYGDNSKEIVSTIRQAIAVDPRFVANLAVFARKELHLRTISHVLVAELAHANSGKPYVREAIREVVERPDDMKEILAYYLNTHGKPIPNSMKKGLDDAITRFDEYSLAKYNGGQGAIKLKDIILLARPKPTTPAQAELFKRVIEDRLEVPVTWETELSAKGNTAAVWENLIAENKVGYMALLRNMKNIIQSGAKNVSKVYETIANPERVRTSKQLPFRYLSALKTLERDGVCTKPARDALSSALEISVMNLPKLTGTTAIIIDVSGSMTGATVSGKSEMRCAEVAALMASIANSLCEKAVVMAFDTHVHSVNFDPKKSVLENVNGVRMTGGGTNIPLPIQKLTNDRTHVDRIIMLSDNEVNSGWDGRWRGVPGQEALNEYRKLVNPNVWMHGIDLAGYGTQQFKDAKTNIMAGFSEKLFEYMVLVENGMDSLKNRIGTYQFR